MIWLGVAIGFVGFPILAVIVGVVVFLTVSYRTFLRNKENSASPANVKKAVDSEWRK